jgi:hypothetical protein
MVKNVWAIGFVNIESNFDSEVSRVVYAARLLWLNYRVLHPVARNINCK